METGIFYVALCCGINAYSLAGLGRHSTPIILCFNHWKKK
jgi:hypothetical protein